MNIFARFDENPAMTLEDIKETKRYGRTDARTHTRTLAHTDARTDNVKTVYPPQTKFAGGIITKALIRLPGCTDWSAPVLCCLQTHEDRFSHVEGHILLTLNFLVIFTCCCF